MSKYRNSFQLCLSLFLIGQSSLSASVASPFNADIKALIFDCDGVIVDTEYLKYLAWKEALSTINVDFSIEEYQPLVGHSSKNILNEIRKLKALEIPDEIITLKNSKYKDLQRKGVPPIQEMITFIKNLGIQKDSFGIKIGLSSSGSKAEILENLTQVSLSQVFDVIVSGSGDLKDYIDSEGTNKPKPYIYLETAKRLNLDPSECLVFEDSEAGVQAAFEAGMTVIAVPNKFTAHQNFSKAAKVIWSYSDLPVFEATELKNKSKALDFK